jgi:hypothetical protein
VSISAIPLIIELEKGLSLELALALELYSFTVPTCKKVGFGCHFEQIVVVF